jgi:hypothetical protein
MNPADIPPNVFIESALKAMAKANIEATIVYTVEKNGKRKTSAASNKGPEGIARAANVLKFGDGAIERAAVAMHAFRVIPTPEELNFCYVCHLADPWEQLEDVDKEGHRELVKVVLGSALAQVASTPLVSV